MCRPPASHLEGRRQLPLQLLASCLPLRRQLLGSCPRSRLAPLVLPRAAQVLGRPLLLLLQLRGRRLLLGQLLAQAGPLSLHAGGWGKQ